MDLTDMTYESAYEKLESIVERMSSGSVPLDELMKLFEEGMELASYCDRLLKSFDAKLEKISSAAMPSFESEAEKE